MSNYNAFTENPGFKLWNVANVKRPDETTWEFELIGREKEMIATATIKKLTLAEVQQGILSLDAAGSGGKPWSAREDCGFTIVNRDAVYETYVSIEADVSLQYGEAKLKSYLDAGLQENVIYKMAKKNAENARAKYEAWKALPQSPLENAIKSKEPLVCYFGLPTIVYMHLVGQLSTNI
jgi:hypothetical protein